MMMWYLRKNIDENVNAMIDAFVHVVDIVFFPIRDQTSSRESVISDDSFAIRILTIGRYLHNGSVFSSAWNKWVSLGQWAVDFIVEGKFSYQQFIRETEGNAVPLSPFTPSGKFTQTQLIPLHETSLNWSINATDRKPLWELGLLHEPKTE